MGIWFGEEYEFKFKHAKYEMEGHTSRNLLQNVGNLEPKP
jgi:hypothetical protein